MVFALRNAELMRFSTLPPTAVPASRDSEESMEPALSVLQDLLLLLMDQGAPTAERMRNSSMANVFARKDMLSTLAEFVLFAVTYQMAS